MVFKLVSKNNLGVVASLALVILLSQSRFFNFLLDTALGRGFLILFILAISYTNKILGVASVLFIIVMFNSSDIGYLEGFTAPSSESSSNSSMPSSRQSQGTTSTDTESSKKSDSLNLTDEQKKQLLSQLQAKSKERDTSTVTNSSSVAAEGFDIIGAENNIKRGKQSNSIPINSGSNNAENILPFESFQGGANFSAF